MLYSCRHISTQNTMPPAKDPHPQSPFSVPDNGVNSKEPFNKPPDGEEIPWGSICSTPSRFVLFVAMKASNLYMGCHGVWCHPQNTRYVMCNW
ncbi:hypothetical protein AVEN_12951-1 [Araneus ventricosus]|uniref:Uncharacterized protein n=1 Tax=Araneus ventricosus TaxID=182803 RepID=A0A4Y2IMQ4_ARAVE|nr:hypothetical protein AVEN_12951-1 [Araneus ventricosus]